MDVSIATNQDWSEQAIKFLEERGVDLDTAQRLGLRASDQNGASFIVFDYGTHQKYRNIKDKHNTFIEGGPNLPLWNAEVLEDETLKDYPLLITEGEFDAISAIQAGYPRTVSVPNGAKALSDMNINYILDHTNDNEDIIIGADGDCAGIELRTELSARLGRSRTKYLKYPLVRGSYRERTKDLNEVLGLYGENGVKEVINRAEYIHVSGLYQMDDLPEVKTKELYSIGIAGLDKVKVRLGEWSVFTGIPGHGKSTFMTEWASHANQLYGWKTMFASFEHPPQEDHKENLQRWYLQADPAYARPERLEEANKWINEAFTFCYPDYEQDVSINWLFDIIETSVKRYGTKLVIIDPWNMIDHENNEMEMTGTKYVAACLREFRRLAAKLNIHLCIVAHPTKVPQDKNGKYQIPTLYNISDSANWNNMCNVGFIIHRDSDSDMVTLRVEKCKYGSKLGISNREDFYLSFNTQAGRYRETDPVIEE